jgi:serine/threonine protein kinase
MLAPGAAIARYEVVEELGRGGMAVVYLARHVDLAKLVALKELTLGTADASLAERFIREARTSGALGHPNVVAVFDYFEHEGLPYIAMEYVAGGPLRPLVGRLTLAQIAGVLEGVLAGLAHAERHGIVHRDLKPENLLVTEEGLIKIADFGIAKAVDRTSVGQSLTAAGMTIGTPRYMAPEQAKAERVGPSADLYSLGVIAYELLTGRVPFGDADTPFAALLMQHISEPVPDPLERNPDLDPEVAAWTLRLLAKDPADRPPGAADAWDELEPTVLRLLGGRWRRDAPLPVPEPRPSLPPAPFETPSPADGADEYATYNAPLTHNPAHATPGPEPADPPPPDAATPASPTTPPPPTAAPRPPTDPSPPPLATPEASPPTAVPPATTEPPPATTEPPPPTAGPPATAEPVIGEPPRRRNPLVPILLAAAAALIIVSAVLGLGSGGGSAQKVSAAAPTPTQSATATATATAATLSERQVVDRIAGILDFSNIGHLLRNQGKFAQAIPNRSETLRRVQALERQTNRLSTQLHLLEAAARGSLKAVQAYAACGNTHCAPNETQTALTAKQAFVASFNPLARRYLHQSYTPSDF